MTATSNKHSTSTEAISGRWRLDPQRSSVEFRTGHLWGLMTVTGRFDGYEGRLDLSADPPIELTIDAASLHSGNRVRDKHLRSPAFFDAENHPRVRFTSDSLEWQGDDLKASGQLCAGGRSIPLEVDARLREVDGGLEIEAVATVRHRELGMTYSPLGMISAQSELLVKGYLTPYPSSRE